MRKTIAAILLFSILTVGCSNNSLKSNDPDSVTTQKQMNNKKETQHQMSNEKETQNQGKTIFESKEDIQNGIKSKVASKTYYEEPASLKDKNTIILNGLLKGEFVEVVTNDNTPKLPMKGKDLEGFIPEGWNIKSSAEGDLNMDSLPDIAAVIEKDDDEDLSFQRILFVLVQDKDKSYTLTVKTASAIMRANEGGVFGEPFESISIDRGSILLSFYGGSNWRWYKQYRFRFQNDGWYLIGATLGSYFTGTTTKENADEEDYNLLTGDYIIKKADEKGIVNTTKGNREKSTKILLIENGTGR